MRICGIEMANYQQSMSQEGETRTAIDISKRETERERAPAQDRDRGNAFCIGTFREYSKCIVIRGCYPWSSTSATRNNLLAAMLRVCRANTSLRGSHSRCQLDEQIDQTRFDSQARTIFSPDRRIRHNRVSR